MKIMIRQILFLIVIVGMILCRPGFLNLSIIDILSQIIICVRGCLLHWSMFSNILGLYPLDVSSTPPQCDIQKCLQILPSTTQKANCLWLRTNGLKHWSGLLNGITLAKSANLWEIYTQSSDKTSVSLTHSTIYNKITCSDNHNFLNDTICFAHIIES